MLSVIAEREVNQMPEHQVVAVDVAAARPQFLTLLAGLRVVKRFAACGVGEATIPGGPVPIF
jgi:hypothetical protein